MEQKQLIGLLYMSSVNELLSEIDTLLEGGHEVSVVTPVREMREPGMNGVVITDWLIIYSTKGFGEEI